MYYGILWKVHAILMASALLSVTAGILISLLRKGRRNTYKLHRTLGLYAALSGLIALLIAVTMVQTSSGIHLSSPHSYLGLITALLLICTPLIMLLKKTRTKKTVRRLHRFIGYLTVLLMVSTIVTGLFFVGILA